MTQHLVALLTGHNRVDKTLTCLEALEAQRGVDVDMDVVLCGAGSIDGTVQRVRERFPFVVVLETGPDLFWNAGMRCAFEYAVQEDYDFYLWLNDDTVLDPEALAVLLANHRHARVRPHHPAIIVGSVRDPTTGALTYGGVTRTDRTRPLKFILAPRQMSRLRWRP